jgi:ribosomal protein S18 acetylase RimI-like enzyme
MRPIQIRPVEPVDLPFLVSMLIEAVSFAADRRGDPVVMLRDPRLAGYLEGWPREGDQGLIAIDNNAMPLGACWLRYRSADAPGYGFLAPDVPELTIAVAPQARGNGVGRALLRAIAAEAIAAGLPALSLSVVHANDAARHLYRDEGWRIVMSEADADTMVLDLSSAPSRAGSG